MTTAEVATISIRAAAKEVSKELKKIEQLATIGIFACVLTALLGTASFAFMLITVVAATSYFTITLHTTRSKKNHLLNKYNLQ